MTSAVPPPTQDSLHAHQASPADPNNSSLSGAVPAQLPVRSYASATKTATPTASTPAGASSAAQNAKPASDSPVNGGASNMAQGGPQAASTVPNGTPSTTNSDHGRKPSVIINSSGASGYTPNGGPVVGTNGQRPPISFGSINSQGSPMPAASAPYSSQTSLATPSANPRSTTPTHSPSPIPQPPASGGRPPSGLQSQSNGMQFGSMGGESDQMRQGQMPPAPMGPGSMPAMHERRTSSQSMHSHSGSFVPGNGRGRGFPPQQPYGMPSPGPGYRQTQPPRSGPNMNHQFQPGMAPGSPYNRGRNSPALPHQQPNMPPQHMGGNAQMGYGYPQGPQQHQQQGMYPQFDPMSGYYQPYWGYQGGPQSQPSPRPYPTPYSGAPQGQMQPPFHPPNMSRSTSQASERPSSGMGQPQTPSMPHAPPPSQTPVSGQPQQSQPNQFVKPKKTSSAVVIKDANGNPINFGKASPAPPASTSSTPAQPSGPVIVSTPSAPTPPPRAPSNQHNRVESKSTKTAEETKKDFQEQIKRQMEERRKNEEAEAAKSMDEKPEVEVKETKSDLEAAPKETIKEAAAEAEKAAAADAGDKPGEEAAAVAESAVKKDDAEKDEHEETEEERFEREIAEMEAKEKEEEEREKAYQEKKRKEKEAAAEKEKEAADKADEELKRQEREAEEREEQKEKERERERAAAEKGADETDDQAKDMFAQLKKPTLGPGASAPESGTETPTSEDADASSMPPPTQPASGSLARGAVKPKPAHLKLETSKRVEPAEPTPGMQALKSARFLSIQEDAKYPDGFKSPNPALNVNGSRKGRAYDKDFLLQFQNVFKEKPSVDWDQKVKETLGPGDEPGSARAGSGRPAANPMGPRNVSGRGGPAPQNFGGAMGQFGNMPSRTLPPNTTSEQRFANSMQGGRPGMGAMPGQMGGRGQGQFGMPQGVGMSRNPSLQMGNLGGPGSPRQASARGKGSSRRGGGDRAMSKKEEAEMAAKMPLTAHMEVKALEKSTTGWKASSIGQPMSSQHDVSGNLTPELVQRKVKAALNKMTPENFEKISDQILEIAAQSKNETDGRTLRQVIQLTFEKACDEAHWANMYARFCQKMLISMNNDISDETIRDKNNNPVVGGALFRKYLLNRCQEEFERGWQVNLPEAEGKEGADFSDEYYAAAAAKRKGLGLIQFIGQLYKLRMLTLRIMHECVMKLLNFEGPPDEAAVENLTTLLKSVGSTMEEDEQGSKFMDAYFERIDSVLLKNEALPSRPKFMIMDLVDLRKAGWKGKDDNKGPKTIQQIREEAEATAAKQAAADAQRSRGGPGGGRPPQGRGDSRQFSGNMAPPVDYQRNNVNLDDLRKLQARGQSGRNTGGGLGPGGSLGPGSLLGARSGSRRGAGNLGPPSSGNTTRTNTPPVGDKKEEASSTNAFNALASLDPSGEAHDDNASVSEAASPPTRAKSPLAATEKTEDSSTA